MKISFAVFASESAESAKRMARALRRRTAWKISREQNLVALTGIVVRENNEGDIKEALRDYCHFAIVCGGIGSALVDWGTLEVGLSSTVIRTPDWEEEIGVMYLPTNTPNIVDVFSEAVGIGHYLGRGVLTENGVNLRQ